jgi:hypothetical protein
MAAGVAVRFVGWRRSGGGEGENPSFMDIGNLAPATGRCSPGIHDRHAASLGAVTLIIDAAHLLSEAPVAIYAPLRRELAGIVVSRLFRVTRGNARSNVLFLAAMTGPPIDGPQSGTRLK